MKKWFWIGIVSGILWGCQDKDFVLKPATGSTNQLTVIIEDALWNGEVGDSLRKKLAAPINGLPQEEPLFSLIQHRDRTGEDHFCKSRNIIIVEKSTDTFFEVRNNDFALNQSVIYLSGKNVKDIIGLIEAYQDSVISTIKNFEIRETQKSLSLALGDTKKIDQKFGISLLIPDTYQYVRENDKFVWLKKEIQSGSLNLLIYETPYKPLPSQTEAVPEIIRVRDSLGKSYIHAQGESPDAYMVTEEAYAPYFKTLHLSNHKAYQTRGTWELRHIFMSGPFLNYTIFDPENNRNLILEGFVYAPSSSKRDMMHELEAIIKSIQFNNSWK